MTRVLALLVLVLAGNHCNDGASSSNDPQQQSPSNDAGPRGA